MRMICILLTVSILEILMIGAQPSDTLERDAAKIALLELNASLDLNPKVAKDEAAWHIRSSGDRLTSDQVVALLMKSPKPIECRATTDLARRVQLDCHKPSDSLSKFMQVSADYVLDRIQKTWANPDTAVIDVLVQSAWEESVVSYSSFAYWLRSYSVGNVSMEYLFDPPPEEALRLGARMSVRFTRRL
jgi:hypothetical protein